MSLSGGKDGGVILVRIYVRGRIKGFSDVSR